MMIAQDADQQQLTPGIRRMPKAVARVGQSPISQAPSASPIQAFGQRTGLLQKPGQPGALAKKMGTDFGGAITPTSGQRMPAPTGAAPGATAMPMPTGTLAAQPGAPTPMPLPGGVPGVTGAAISPINPKQDLRFNAITPDNAGAPDLTALASQKFSDFMAGQADERAQGVRSIGQAAAKFGRIGAGMTTNQLTSLEDLLQRRENEAARGLASDVALSDLGERRSQRDELRGERGYQYGVGRDAINDRVNERLLEEQLLNSRFGRAATRTQLGYQGNPSGTQFAAGESYGRSADDALGGLGEYLGNRELLAELARLRAAQSAPPASPAPLGKQPKPKGK